jgi:hypothetical protein
MPKKRTKSKPRRTSTGTPIDVAPQRTAFALRLMCDLGVRYSETRRRLMAKFGISDSTAERDIERAYKQMGERNEKERPHLGGHTSARLWRIAGKAEREGKYDAAVNALGRFAKINGLEAPKKHHHTGGVTEEQKQLLAALALTPVERAKRIAELEAEAAAEGGGEVESEP